MVKNGIFYTKKNKPLHGVYRITQNNYHFLHKENDLFKVMRTNNLHFFFRGIWVDIEFLLERFSDVTDINKLVFESKKDFIKKCSYDWITSIPVVWNNDLFRNNMNLNSMLSTEVFSYYIPFMNIEIVVNREEPRPKPVSVYTLPIEKHKNDIDNFVNLYEKYKKDKKLSKKVKQYDDVILDTISKLSFIPKENLSKFLTVINDIDTLKTEELDFIFNCSVSKIEEINPFTKRLTVDFFDFFHLMEDSKRDDSITPLFNYKAAEDVSEKEFINYIYKIKKFTNNINAYFYDKMMKLTYEYTKDMYQNN